jgi:DNA-3-methyladenine glycosylase
MKKLGRSFYLRDDVLTVARELVGKILVTDINGVRTSGIITETEAYGGITDRASHAWNGRRTNRTEIMYGKGGTAYVYLCYGIHHLFNVVTNEKNVPHAVLIRSVEPLEGVDTMLARRKKEQLDFSLTTGPGSLAEALGIRVHHTGLDLLGKEIWIEDRNFTHKIAVSARIGVEYSGADALRPYRFYADKNKWVSRQKPASEMLFRK